MNKKPIYKILLFCFSCILFLGCDRTTKSLAKEHLKDESPLFYLNDMVILHYTENTGAAMSLGANLPQPFNFLLLSLIPLLFIIILFIYALKKINEFNRIKLFSLSLLVAGGLGNITDRIIYDRHVTDFLVLKFGNFHTGIFNVADMCVLGGVIGILFFFSDRKLNQEKVV